LENYNDLSNLIEKLRYIVNLEGEDVKFNIAFQELVKLRILEVLENGFFKVYSKEILQIMSDYFEKTNSLFRSGVISRIKQVTRDKRLDNEHALLDNANSARYSKSEEEVTSLYRQILNRASAPLEVKLQAIFNLTDYLFNNKGKRDSAIKVFQDFDHLFRNEPLAAKMHSNYCWANDQHEEAVSILSELFANKADFHGNHTLRYELLGLLLTYRSILAIQQKEDIKTKSRFGEISRSEFFKKNDESKQIFHDIFKHQGIILFDHLRNGRLSDIGPSARQSITTGLYQFTNICMRIRKYDIAIGICEHAINNFPNYLERQFQTRLDYIKSLKDQNSDKCKLDVD
jgi:tetratricopeptide (TPR) repeat protein